MLMEKPARRAGYVMVDENDPQFARFWNAYPRRTAKKDARRVWAKVDPSPELVDRMLATLAWQVPHFRWDSDKAEFAPYPASWLNGERWTDEPPALVPPPAPKGKAMSDGAALVFETLGMKL